MFEHHKAYVLAGAAISFIITSGAAIGYMRWGQPTEMQTYVHYRSINLVSQAEAFGKVDTLVLGDSIVEGNALDGLCGRTFAAGVGGGGVEDLNRIVPALLAATTPHSIVVALGTNDVLEHKGEGQPFRDRYAHLISTLPVKPFALVGIAQGQNEFIRHVAYKIGAVFIPPIAPALTKDGIHPTRPGLKLWRERVSAVCPSINAEQSL
jgi:hypothetical protein